MMQRITIGLFFVLSGFAFGQTASFPDPDAYRKSVHAITDQTIQLLLAWEKSCITENKAAETRAYEELKQYTKKAIRDLRAIRGFRDPGFHAAAVELVKYVYREVNLTIAEIHDNPPSHYSSSENAERFRNKREDVVSLMRAEEERFLFKEALLVGKENPLAANSDFCTMVTSMISTANQGFPDYKGGYRGTGRNERKEYEVLKTIPGALKGLFVERDGLPGVEYILFESEDSASAARRVHEIAKEVLSCNLPGLEGVFEYRVPHRQLKRESSDIHTRYLIYHRVGDGYLEPCKIEVTMRRPYGKYEAVLAFIRFE